MKLIETTLLPLSAIEPNRGQIDGLPKNPRVLRDAKFDALKKSITDDPDMLALRELLVYQHGDKYVIIGGNMRYRALKELKYKDAPCKIIPADTPVETLRAYTIKDNGDFGEWDFDLLANEWDDEPLNDWGVDIPILTEAVAEEEKDEAYTRKVVSPVYKPTGEMPTFAEMVDTSKCDALLSEIDSADIPDDVKMFLREAAHRHTVFNYANIANYYAHATPEVQNLMERSALVIIDFDKAIEYGFVHLTTEFAKAYKIERGISDNAITASELTNTYDEA